MDELVQAMGLTGISKSQVAQLCQDIDKRVGALLDRPITGACLYLWLDATHLKPRDGRRIVWVVPIIAAAVRSEGKREIIGLHIGPSEAETFRATFLKSLVRRGLRGVDLVITDAHEGLKTALRQAFNQPDRAAASQTLRHVAARLRQKWPKLGALIHAGAADMPAYMKFPAQHRSVQVEARAELDIHRRTTAHHHRHAPPADRFDVLNGSRQTARRRWPRPATR